MRKAKMAMTDEAKRRHFTKQLEKLINSPFPEDRRFVINFISHNCRDEMNSFEDIINALFYDKIHNLILDDPFEYDWETFYTDNNK